MRGGNIISLHQVDLLMEIMRRLAVGWLKWA
jgi:hypothetical protein